MNIITKQEDWLINEGKNSPVKVGDFVRINNKFVKDYQNSVFHTESYRNWEKATNLQGSRYSWSNPTQDKKRYREAINSDKDITFFYAYVKKSGIKWAECELVFINSEYFSVFDGVKQVRFDMKVVTVPTPGPELKMFQESARKYPDLYVKNINNAQKFLKGNEDYVLNSKGESIGKFTSGKYDAAGINYEMSEKMKQTVMCILEESKDLSKADMSDFYYVTADSFFGSKNELSEEVLEVVAKKISKIIGVEVAVRNGMFSIPWFSVKSKKHDENSNDDKNNPFASRSYSAEPFFTYSQAEKQIENLKEINKKERLSFDVNTLKIERCIDGQNFKLSFSQLVEYASTFGLNFDFDEFVEKNKGGISAKKFGF